MPGTYRRVRRLRDAAKLLRHWTRKLHDSTESWSGQLGTELAYLCHGVLNNHKVELKPTSPLLQKLTELDPDRGSDIWFFVCEVNDE